MVWSSTSRTVMRRSSSSSRARSSSSDVCSWPSWPARGRARGRDLRGSCSSPLRRAPPAPRPAARRWPGSRRRSRRRRPRIGSPRIAGAGAGAGRRFRSRACAPGRRGARRAPSSAARIGGPLQQALDGRRGGDLRAGVEVDQLAVEPVADRPPEVLLDQPAGNGPRRAGRHRSPARPAPTQAVASASSAVDSPAQDCASMIRTSTVPNVRCGRTLHQICVCSIDRVRAEEEVDVGRVGLPAAEVVRDSAAREHAREDLRARGVQAGRDGPLDPRRVRRRGQQHRQHRAQRVADRDGAVGAPDADVHVVAEGVVAPRHVLAALSSTSR